MANSSSLSLGVTISVGQTKSPGSMGVWLSVRFYCRSIGRKLIKCLC